MIDMSDYASLVSIRSLYAIIALLLSVFLGLLAFKIKFVNARPSYHRLLEVIFGQFFQRLDRKGRSKGQLAFRGAFLMVFICIFSVAIAILIKETLVLNDAFVFLEILLLASLILSTSYMVVLYRLFFLFKEKKARKGKFYSLAVSTGYDLNSLDDYGIVRISISFVPFVLWRYIVAPLFWYVLFGIVGAIIYSSILFVTNIANPRRRGGSFSVVSELIEKAMSFFPSLIVSVVIIFVSLFTPKLSVFGVFKLKSISKYDHGWLPLSILASILGVVLGGSVKYIDGKTYKNSWAGIDSDSSKIDFSQIKKVLFLSFVSILSIILILLLIFLSLN